MRDRIPFHFEGEPVQVVMHMDDDLESVATDVCRVLDMQDVISALRILDADEKGPLTVRTPGGEQTVNGISGPGCESARNWDPT
jgi:prophage antirepressor-like protein